MGKLTEKRKAFVAEYLIDMNGTQAAKRAGYSAKSAHKQAYQLLGDPDVQAALREAMEARAERKQIEADDVIQRFIDVAFADPNELASVVICSCRYCHGTDHQYQWRDEEEFERAQEVHFSLPDEQRAKQRAPVIGGGFGFSPHKAPHPNCTHCDGFGREHVVLRDTTKLSPRAKALFAGVKQTQHGIEVKSHDQLAALLNIGRHLGMFPSNVSLTGPDGGPIKTETINTNMTPKEAADAYAATLDGNKG